MAKAGVNRVGIAEYVYEFQEVGSDATDAADSTIGCASPRQVYDLVSSISSAFSRRPTLFPLPSFYTHNGIGPDIERRRWVRY